MDQRVLEMLHTVLTQAECDQFAARHDELEMDSSLTPDQRYAALKADFDHVAVSRVLPGTDPCHSATRGTEPCDA